jgi:hypothetical protein
LLGLQQQRQPVPAQMLRLMRQHPRRQPGRALEPPLKCNKWYLY